MNSLNLATGNCYSGSGQPVQRSQSGSVRESLSDLEVQAYHTFSGLQNLSEEGRALVLRQVIAMHNQQTRVVKNRIETPPAQVTFKNQSSALNNIIKELATILTVVEIQEFEIILGFQPSVVIEACFTFPNSTFQAKEAFFRQYFLQYGIAWGITLLLNNDIGFYPMHQEQISTLLNAMRPELLEF